MTTTTHRPGDVVLLHFPFTDGLGSKRRPVVVLLDLGDADIVVAPISSRLRASPYHVEIDSWSNVGLLKPSIVRLHKVQTVRRSLLQSHVGSLEIDDRPRLAATLTQLCA